MIDLFLTTGVLMLRLLAVGIPVLLVWYFCDSEYFAITKPSIVAIGAGAMLLLSCGVALFASSSLLNPRFWFGLSFSADAAWFLLATGAALLVQLIRHRGLRKA